MLNFLFGLLPGWHSIARTEGISKRLIRYSVHFLAIVTLSDFGALIYSDNEHGWFPWASAIALAVVTIVEYIDIAYDNRATTLRRKESIEEERKRKGEISQLRSDAAESAATTHIASSFLLDRTFSDDQIELLKNRLSEYKGQEFKISKVAKHAEALGFAEKIEYILLDCGWIPSDALNIDILAGWFEFDPEIPMVREIPVPMEPGIAIRIAAPCYDGYEKSKVWLAHIALREAMEAAGKRIAPAENTLTQYNIIEICVGARM